MHKQLFTERFRPSNMDEILLPKRIRDEFLDPNNLNQNYLLVGSQGNGKTSLAKILAKDTPYMYINVSDESSVDVIRTKITDFCSTISVVDGTNKLKVVILDEMDGASEQFYKALRGTIEKFANQARFIGTCNYINKIPDPIQSRFSVISFNSMTKEEEVEIKISIIKRIFQLSKTLNINFSQDAIVEFVKRNYPDMRSMMNKLQSFNDREIKKITIDDIKQLNYTFNDVFKLIVNETDPEKIYVLLMSKYINKTNELMTALSSEFPNYIRETHPTLKKHIPAIVITNAEYQAMKNNIDHTTPMLANVFKLSNILMSK